MKRSTSLTLVLLCFGMAVPREVCSAPAAEDLLQQAMLKESGERNLDAAIPLYKQVIADPDATAILRMEARIQLGNCYERLEKVEDAKAVYEDILKNSASGKAEFAQEAQSRLRHIESEQRRIQRATAPVKAAPIFIAGQEYRVTRLTLQWGPAVVSAPQRTLTRFVAGVRYPLTSSQRAFPVYLEGSALLPIGRTSIFSESKMADPLTEDQGALRLDYQTSLSVIGELPHGMQRVFIPEIGVGMALTHAVIEATSNTNSVPAASGAGRSMKNTFSPYAVIGAHLFADHIISLLVQGTYTTVPYPETVDISPPAHQQTFNTPSSIWSLVAKVQWRVGWPRPVLKPKS